MYVTPSYAVFTMPAGTRFRRHEHAGFHACAVLSGGFVERQGRSWVEVPPGTIRISDSARHDIDFSPAGARCLVLHAPDPGDADWPANLRFLPPGPWNAGLLTNLDLALASEAGPLVREDLAIELLAQIARRLRGRNGPPPSWLGRVRERIHDAPGPLSVSGLASGVGIHRVYLARAFREHCGVSVTAYMRRVRLDRAWRLLAHGPLPLTDVAAAVGFSDQSHMTRALRSAIGATPGAVRRGLHPFKTESRAPG